MIWWRLCILIVILLSTLWIVSRNQFYRLIKNPRGWLIHSWTRTIRISLLIIIISSLLIPIVHLLTEDIVQHQLIDIEAHMQTKIIAISPLLMLGIAIVLAFVEELVFRLGFLEFFKQKHGVGIGLLVSSLAFASYHLIDPAVSFLLIIPCTVAGLMLGMAYLKAGLVGSILTHVGCNVIALLPTLI